MTLLQEIEKEAKKYALYHYGNLLSVDEPIFDKDERLWKVKLRADYPRLIRNEYPEERFVRTLLLKDLGTVFVNEKFEVIKSRSTARSECVETLRARLRTWQEKAESIVVKTSSLQLANTSTAHIFLNPISTILANFFEEEPATISFAELEKLRKTERYFQWIYLLEELQLVRRTEDGYTYGNMFTEIRRRFDNDREFLTHVLAYVIRERYPILKDIFALRQFETLVHLDSCYYTPALEARKILFRRAESLFSQYLSTYRHRSRLELPRILHELHESQALNRKDNYYQANPELFEKMLISSEEFLTVFSPRA